MTDDRQDATRLDAEMLATLLDGSLSDEERVRVLESLGASEADLEVLADASVALAEAEAAPVSSTPGRAIGVRRLASWKVLVPLAAAVGAIVLVPGRTPRSPVAETFSEFERLALADANVDRALRSVRDAPGWDVTRGIEVVLSPEARAFRVGALLTELALAVATPAAAPDSSLVAEVDALLSTIPNGHLLESARLLAPGEVAADRAWRDLADAAPSIVIPPELFELGAWTQRVRLRVLLGLAAADWLSSSVDEFADILGRLPASERASAGPALSEIERAFEEGRAEVIGPALVGLARALGGS